MELIRKEDALRAITKNLDRINGHKEGTGLLVAMDWLEDVETINTESAAGSLKMVII